MTYREKVVLLFGPYKPPCLKAGERAFCLARDRLIVITGWSDARLSWPLGHALDPRGAGRGMLVEDELERAIRHESVLALCYWWGISRGTAERWRRIFGVGRMDSEGSRRLILGVVQQGIVTRTGRQATRGRRRGRSIAGVVPAGDLGLLWTPEEIALVGVLADAEVARRTGRSRDAVRQMRERLGRPDPARPQKQPYLPWTAEQDELAMRLPAREVAERTGHTRAAVYQRRLKLKQNR